MISREAESSTDSNNQNAKLKMQNAKLQPKIQKEGRV